MRKIDSVLIQIAIWFQRFLIAQPEIFAENMVLHYTHTTWIPLHSYNLIPEVYICATWNLCWWYHCTLHSHNLIFTTFVQLDSGFCTWTTWNLNLYGKVTYFTLHSHTLIFITLAKRDFSGLQFLLLCVHVSLFP